MSDRAAHFYNAAGTLAQLGEVEQALDLLERAVEREFGFRRWIEKDPDLAPLREHPRYAGLLAGLP